MPSSVGSYQDHIRVLLLECSGIICVTQPLGIFADRNCGGDVDWGDFYLVVRVSSQSLPSFSGHPSLFKS